MDWQPRLLRAGEEPALLQLFLDAYGTWPKPEISVPAIDHLRWKLEGAREPFRAVVVEQDGQLIAGVLLSERPLRLKGRELIGNMGGDLAVLPGFQGKGVFTSMQPFLHEVHYQIGDFSYGYRSQHKAVRKAAKHMGRRIFGDDLAVLVHGTSITTAAQDQASWKLCRVGAFDERVNDLWAQAAPQFDFICARTAKFLNWRYCDRRGGDFSVVIAEQDGALLGYVVVRISHGRGYIADLLVLPSRLDVHRSLIEAALRDLLQISLDRVECWLPSRHVYVPSLVELGFAPERATKQMTYQPFRVPESELSFLRSPQTAVHVSAGDTDLV